MALVKKFSQIAAAVAAPALTDTLLGVGSGTTDLQYTLAQVQSAYAAADWTWTGSHIFNKNTAAAPANAGGSVLQVVGADSNVARVEADSFGAIAAFTARRANGTNASKTAIASGDQIGAFNYHGYYVTGGPAYSGVQASVQGLATQNWTSTTLGTKVVISTTPNGSTALTTALTIDQDQSATFNSTSALGPLVTVAGVQDVSAAGVLFRATNNSASHGLVTRTELYPFGGQTWWLNDGANSTGTEVGRIVYTTPGGRAGIVFFDGSVASRSDMRHISGGGFDFGSNSGSGTPQIGFRIDPSTARFGSTLPVGWTASNAQTALDTAFSRISAGVAGLGTGAAAATDGYLQLTGVLGQTGVTRFGAADVDTNAAIVAQGQRTQGALAGGTSNQAGKDFTFSVSPGKGTGAGGKYIIQTAPAGASGTSVNAFATGLTVTAPAVNMQPSVVVGNQALATTATDGFLYIPQCAGTPTGVPTAQTGRVPMVWDKTNKIFYIYDGGWLGGTAPGVFS